MYRMIACYEMGFYSLVRTICAVHNSEKFTTQRKQFQNNTEQPILDRREFQVTFGSIFFLWFYFKRMKKNEIRLITQCALFDKTPQNHNPAESIRNTMLSMVILLKCVKYAMFILESKATKKTKKKKKKIRRRRRRWMTTTQRRMEWCTQRSESPS